MRKLFATSLQRHPPHRHEGTKASCTYVSNFNSMSVIGRPYLARRKHIEPKKLSQGVIHQFYAIKRFAPAFSIRTLSSTTVNENKQHDEDPTKPFHEPINIKQVLSPSKTVEYHVKISKKTNDQQLVQNVPPSSLFARMVSSYFDLVSYFLPKGYPASTGIGILNTLL